jgi:hypothetical protein
LQLVPKFEGRGNVERKYPCFAYTVQTMPAAAPVVFGICFYHFWPSGVQDIMLAFFRRVLSTASWRHYT